MKIKKIKSLPLHGGFIPGLKTLAKVGAYEGAKFLAKRKIKESINKLRGGDPNKPLDVFKNINRTTGEKLENVDGKWNKFKTKANDFLEKSKNSIGKVKELKEKISKKKDEVVKRLKDKINPGPKQLKDIAKKGIEKQNKEEGELTAKLANPTNEEELEKKTAHKIQRAKNYRIKNEKLSHKDNLETAKMNAATRKHVLHLGAKQHVEEHKNELKNLPDQDIFYDAEGVTRQITRKIIRKKHIKR